MLRNVTSCQEAISLTRPFGEARLSLFQETFQDPVLGSDFVDVPRQFFPYMSFPGHWKIWGFTSGLSYSRDLQGETLGPLGSLRKVGNAQVGKLAILKLGDFTVVSRVIHFELRIYYGPLSCCKADLPRYLSCCFLFPPWRGLFQLCAFLFSLHCVLPPLLAQVRQTLPITQTSRALVVGTMLRETQSLQHADTSLEIQRLSVSQSADDLGLPFL